jgi:hypothetical protein
VIRFGPGHFALLKIAIALAVAIWIGSSPAPAQPATNGLVLWLDSSYESSVETNVVGGVTAWLNLAPGATNSVSYSGTNDNNTSADYNSQAPSYGNPTNGYKLVLFSGNGYLDNLNFSSQTPLNLTVFVLASTSTNPGSFSAFMAFRQPGANDYQTGLNFDQGQNPSTNFNRLNVEGAKAGGGGGFQFDDGVLQFGKFYVYEIDYGSGPADNNSLVRVWVNGVLQNPLTGSPNTVNLTNCFIGTRAYVFGGVPTNNHDLIGQMAAVLVYNYQLTGSDLAQTLGYLNAFFALPTLRISATSMNGVILSWPNRGSFVLQQNADLATANWALNTNAVSVVNSTNQVVIAAATHSLFFRLAAQ